MYTFLFTTIDGVRGFENYSEDHWLMGISLTNPIETEQDKIKKLTYCVKQLQPSSHKIQDLKKIDNWFIEGDFEPNKQYIKVKNTRPPYPIFRNHLINLLSTYSWTN